MAATGFRPTTQAFTSASQRYHGAAHKEARTLPRSPAAVARRLDRRAPIVERAALSARRL